jgi:hypothetical protein
LLSVTGEWVIIFVQSQSVYGWVISSAARHEFGVGDV